MFVLNAAHGLFDVNALYLTPEVTTVLITAISGIAIAVGSTAVVLWRRAKKKAAQVFHIDENANKEVEEELVVKDESDS